MTNDTQSSHQHVWEVRNRFCLECGERCTGCLGRITGGECPCFPAEMGVVGDGR